MKTLSYKGNIKGLMRYIENEKESYYVNQCSEFNRTEKVVGKYGFTNTYKIIDGIKKSIVKVDLEFYQYLDGFGDIDTELVNVRIY